MSKKSSNLVFKTFFTLCLVVLAIIVVSTNIYSIQVKNNEKKALIKKLNKLNEEEKTLTDDVEKLKNPEYAARYAREKYLYSKNGEKILKVN